MSREDLLKKNLAILKDVYLKVKPYLKETIVIIVTNPLDVMTYAFKQLSGIERNHLIGMGPSLDSSRLANLLSQELSVPVNEIKTMVVADHGKDMLPLLRLSTFQDKPIVKRLDQETCHGVKERTIDRGRQIVELFKTGSAYFAPSAAIFQLVRAILEDRKEVIPVCAFLEGEYGLKDIAIGVPAIIAKEGIKEIIELTFTTEEHRAFLSAAEALRKLQSGIV
jgi:malate dehydrogenase